MPTTGKYLIIIGIILIITGAILWLFGNRLGWLGNLPGDIRIKKENFTFYFPITTMILVSAIISFILWIIRKFF
jgi:hypothetical protein